MVPSLQFLSNSSNSFWLQLYSYVKVRPILPELDRTITAPRRKGVTNLSRIGKYWGTVVGSVADIAKEKEEPVEFSDEHNGSILVPSFQRWYVWIQKLASCE